MFVYLVVVVAVAVLVVVVVVVVLAVIVVVANVVAISRQIAALIAEHRVRNTRKPWAFPTPIDSRPCAKATRPKAKYKALSQSRVAPSEYTFPQLLTVSALTSRRYPKGPKDPITRYLGLG